MEVFCIALITPLAIVKGRKITTRKMRIFLDRWYMACNRVIMMTCTTFQSSHITDVLVLRLSNSPPSMAFTTKLNHPSNKKIVMPEKCSYRWAPQDSLLQTNSQLLVVKLKQQGSRESHSPLRRTAVSLAKMTGISTEHSLYLSPRLTGDYLYPACQKKRTQYMCGDIPSTVMLIVRDDLSAVSTC